VTMCALADSSSPNDDPPLDAGAGTCIEVPFQYPTASEVVGTLPSDDAGP
jgi:hypothetical protein